MKTSWTDFCIQRKFMIFIDESLERWMAIGLNVYIKHLHIFRFIQIFMSYYHGILHKWYYYILRHFKNKHHSNLFVSFVSPHIVHQNKYWLIISFECSIWEINYLKHESFYIFWKNIRFTSHNAIDRIYFAYTCFVWLFPKIYNFFIDLLLSCPIFLPNRFIFLAFFKTSDSC